MKIKIMNLDGKEAGNTDLPAQFNEPVRADLIKKAVLAIQNNKRQAYGAFDDAGMRHSGELSKRRRKYRGSYGHGISRVPRKILSRRGTQMHWVGTEVPGTVGGRKAHPPKAEKKWGWKLNTTEKRKAIRSAMSAVMNKEMVIQRGHKVPDNYPFIIEDKFEKVSKTKELIAALDKLGFKNELARAEKTLIRSGLGKIRGRKRVVKKSLLIVASDANEVRKAATNIPGIDVVNIKRLNSELLAPGTAPGRATIFTAPALDELKKGLFMKDYKGESMKKDKEQKKESEKAKKEKKAKEKKGKKPESKKEGAEPKKQNKEQDKK